MSLSRRQLIGAAIAAPIVFSTHLPSLARSSTTDPLQRLVSLDLLITELLLTLGITPVAIANIPLYSRLVANPALPPEVQDLGPLSEPNAEFLMKLSPTAVLAADWQAPNLQNLTRAAPIIPLKVFAGQTPALEHLVSLITDISKLTSTEPQAASAVATTTRAIEAARGDLAGFHRPVYICRFSRDGRNIALFGGNGMLGDITLRLGLRNAFTGRVNGAGVTNAPLTRLADAPEAVIVHFDRGEETDAALARLERSAIWHALPAVRHRRVLRMPVIYPNGGLKSAERFAIQLAAKLTGLPNG